jgi:hypothetical protein
MNDGLTYIQADEQVRRDLSKDVFESVVPLTQIQLDKLVEMDRKNGRS